MARRRAMAVVVVLAVVLTGCAGGPLSLVSGPPRPWAVAETVVVDPVEAYVGARLAAMTLEQRIASLIMLHVAGVNPGPIRGVIDATGVAGVIYMGDNVASAEQLAATTAALSADPGLPVLTAIDQEGGIVARLPDSGPGASALRTQDPSATLAAFQARAALVASAGVTINFGIVADVTGDRRSFIYSRTFGADAASASPRVAAAVEGEQGVVFSTLKHFPGHGSVAGDSHTSVPTTAMSADEWRATQAGPFAAGIDAGAEFVMLGHLRYSSIDGAPATLSAAWNAVLRDELGFDGIIVTDDMSMLEHSGEAAFADQRANAVAAIAAGATLLLYVGPVDVGGVVAAVAAAVRDGRIPMATIDDATRRLLEFRRELSDQTGPYVHCGEECRALIG
ncbi:glycoside hydrolase family 3 N-terminal domain-containing protein [Pseudolysinimonas sp.]|uniref:glycoside hydrolase family 3 N-terminal domain-containing protein n=1 Tax=Pseudolysinimonas sp. TaxID=2680009 RepID=UPI00286A481D|nr:glycoside hydrolase family 3 N-terminal domain-containing protein [Pseudolysinimonas sp.]